MAPSTSLAFTVTRREPELVGPANPTPYEYKQLSDIDAQEALRYQIPVIKFYHNNPSMRGRDPVKVIKEAVAKTLVYYYPFAGRLREGPGRKLFVDCTGEGIMFIEADADVTLEQFGDVLQPPFPCLHELLYNVPGSAGVLHCPLLLIQVTRLKCGGFIFGLRLNHTMCDAAGLVLFFTAISEMARGAVAPSTLPVWQRERLNARDPPRITCTHHEYAEVADSTKATIIPHFDMLHRSFFFGPTQVSALRRLVPPYHRASSTIELLTACLWRCRTISLQPHPAEEVSVLCNVNARAKFNPPLPAGYYGNAFGVPAAVTTAGKLCQNPLGYALELVRKAKKEVSEEYMKSVADLQAIKNRSAQPYFTVVRTYLVSDLTRAGFEEVDYGWGKAAYAGPAEGGVVDMEGVASFYIAYRNKRGEKGIAVPMCLPAPAMERFVKELDSMLKDHPADTTITSSTFIKSAL